MKSDTSHEPTLEKIDDYNGKESKEKRRTVILVVVFCLIIGTLLTYLREINLIIQ